MLNHPDRDRIVNELDAMSHEPGFQLRWQERVARVIDVLIGNTPAMPPGLPSEVPQTLPDPDKVAPDVLQDSGSSGTTQIDQRNRMGNAYQGTPLPEPAPVIKPTSAPHGEDKDKTDAEKSAGSKQAADEGAKSSSKVNTSSKLKGR